MVWMANRLEKRGWDNCGWCMLCNQVHESSVHLLFKCRFTLRVWSKVKEWFGIQDINPSNWHTARSVRAWWADFIHRWSPTMKVIGSLTMLISWEIRKERNARVFCNTFSDSMVVLENTKTEATLWSLAGAKALSVVMARE
jgi:hypothetical protein